MAKRRKLTRPEREKKAAKRERRALTGSLRQHLAIAGQRYIMAVLGIGYEPERVICERCGLEQPHRVSPWNGKEVVLAPCARGELLSLPCPSETAITIEAFQALGDTT